MTHTTLLSSPPVTPTPFSSWNLTDNVTSQTFVVAVFCPWNSFLANIPMALLWCLQFFQISPSWWYQSSPCYLKLQPIPLILDFLTMLLFIPLKYHDTYLHTMFILSSLIYKLNKVEIFLSDFFTSKNFHKHSRHIKMLVRMNYLYIHLALSYLKISSWCMWSKQ